MPEQERDPSASTRPAGSGTQQTAAEHKGSYSPPCGLADVDPLYNGCLDSSGVLALLNELLEGERAGARAIHEICLPATPPDAREVMHGVAVDEGRFCTMLHRHIVRLGGHPSAATGAFHSRFTPDASFHAQLELLNRGQGWVVRKLRAELPRLTDPELLADLREMLDVHERNIARCEAIAATSAG